MVLEVNGGRGDCGQVLTGAWRRVAMNSKREDISAALGQVRSRLDRTRWAAT